MKYLDEYRDLRAAGVLLEQLGRAVTRPWTVMEVCGGQALHVTRTGIDRSLPEGLELVHGPACPLCVTPVEAVELAVRIAGRPEVIVCASSGDLLRVSCRRGSLIDARSRGGNVRLVYSALDALALARRQPASEVVFLAVGFETTAPTAAAALLEAERLGLANFSIIAAHLRASAAVGMVLDDPGRRVDAVLAPGHVASVMGTREYEPIVARSGTPIVVTGPEPVDLLEGLLRAVRQLEAGTYLVENQYARAVRPDGNPQALGAIATVFRHADVHWRGLGWLPASGLVLADRFRGFDAAVRFRDDAAEPNLPEHDPCGDVLSGRIKPFECPEFGGRCTPDHARGPAMLSAEGACTAYFRCRRVPEHVPAAAAE